MLFILTKQMNLEKGKQIFQNNNLDYCITLWLLKGSLALPGGPHELGHPGHPAGIHHINHHTQQYPGDGRRLGLKHFFPHHGSGALPGKMLLVRILNNNTIDAYSRSCQVKLRFALSCSVRKGPHRVGAPASARKKKKTPTKLISDNPRSSILPESGPDPNFFLKLTQCTRET